MKFTEDGHMVAVSEKVYEIMWQWINSEVQEPYPYPTTAGSVPEGFMIWKHRQSCEQACLLLKQERSRQLDRLCKTHTKS
jgi:hypothetical protein